MVSRRSGIKFLKLQSTIQIAINPEGEKAENATGFLKLKNLTAVDLEKRFMQIRITNEAGVILLEGQKLLSGGAGPTGEPRLGALLLDPQSTAVTAQIQALAIPVVPERKLIEEWRTEAERQAAEKTRMGRIDGQPSWVVGRESGEGSFWFEKDTYAPQRIETFRADKKLILKLKWPKLVADFPFPRQWILESTPKSAEVLGGAAVSSQLMAREDFQEVSQITEAGFQTLFKSDSRIAYTEAGEELSSGQRAAIDRYIDCLR
jgi:hypothetical protein